MVPKDLREKIESLLPELELFIKDVRKFYADHKSLQDLNPLDPLTPDITLDLGEGRAKDHQGNFYLNIPNVDVEDENALPAYIDWKTAFVRFSRHSINLKFDADILEIEVAELVEESA